MQTLPRIFDWIIVGAGSAGCVLANRLSADPANRVLLIEAGGSDRNILIRMPAAFSLPMHDSRFNWGYFSEPESQLDGRCIDCARGKGFGGSSSINGMVWVRGNQGDFDDWEKLGAKGWRYASVLPYFQRAENYGRYRELSDTDRQWRGSEGPMRVIAGRMNNPLYRAFIKAGIEAGYGETSDYNGYRQEGFGVMDMNVWHGERWSAALAYLHSVRHGRRNLTVLPKSEVLDLSLHEGRVRGVRIRYASGRMREFRATKEVILSAGSIGSPLILMRSGIGEGAHLHAVGITPQHELPGVGKNLMDHMEIYMQRACTQSITLNGILGIVPRALIGVRWLLTRTGPGITNHFESCGFIRSRAGVKWPDLQYHFLPGAISYDGKTATEGHGFQVHIGSLRSRSRGSVRLRDANPDTPPEIRFNYMAYPEDWVEARAAINLTREIFAQPALDPFRGSEITPGPHLQSDEQLDRFLRAELQTAYHPCGTCKMGTDSEAVVDPECKLHGLEGLRVVDSSIMPMIPSGNLNAPTIMLAEKAADMILGNEPPPPFEHENWYASDWRIRQRESAPKRSISD